MGNEDAARVKKNGIRSTVVGSKEVRKELEKRTWTRTRTRTSGVARSVCARTRIFPAEEGSKDDSKIERDKSPMR